MRLSITWLGHSTFLLRLPSGARVVVDPWLGNPKCPPKFARPESLSPVNLILVTHGHGDHTRDLLTLARHTNAPVVCGHELGEIFVGKGLQDVRDMAVGGTQSIGALKVTMTMAAHSSSFTDEDGMRYGGSASGFVLREPGMPTLYIAGDTGLFGDMKVIAELYRPEIAFLPIGDHYTMGPDTAAVAARWLGVKQVVPMHWGTFPILTGTPEMLTKELAGSGIEVLALEPGETAE